MLTNIIVTNGALHKMVELKRYLHLGSPPLYLSSLISASPLRAGVLLFPVEIRLFVCLQHNKAKE